MKTLCLFTAFLLPLVSWGISCSDFVKTWEVTIERLTRQGLTLSEDKAWIQNQLIDGPWNTPKDRATARKILEGDHFPEIALAVHQLPPLQDRTARFLNQSAYSETPLVVLSGPGFQVRDSDLIRRSQLIVPSYEGEFNFPLNVGKIHLFGGRCNACLKLAVRIALDKIFLESQAKELTLVVHTGLSYLDFFVPKNGGHEWHAVPMARDSGFPGTKTPEDLVGSIARTFGTESEKFGAEVNSRSQKINFVILSKDPSTKTAKLLHRSMEHGKRTLIVEFRNSW